MPFVYVGYSQDQITYNVQKYRHNYKRYLDTAVQDASASLLLLSDYDKSNENQRVNINVEEGIRSFFNSLYLQLGNGDLQEGEKLTYQQALIKSYIPVVLIIDYDGFYIYAIDEYTDSEGYTYFKHILFPKQYYSFKSDDYIIQPHLDDYVKVYNKTTGERYDGEYTALSNEVGLFSEQDFEEIKRNYMINQIEESLNFYVNKHNNYAIQYGVVYDFYLPDITYNDWEACLEDIGVMAFMQGIPIYRNEYLNIFALQGSRILKRKSYYGYEKDGDLFYCKSDCEELLDIPEKELEVFDSRKKAAQAGFYPCHNCKP